MTITASTPVDLLVLSKYDVYHRLPPEMRHVLRCANFSSGYNPNSNEDVVVGPRARVEPVVYVDRFVKSTKWEATKRRLVNEGIDHDKIARRLAATAPMSSSPAPPSARKVNRAQDAELRASRSELPSPRDTVDHKKRPLLDANDFVLVRPEKDAIASAFVRPDCVAGHASLGRYVTEFNADAPPSAARSRQLRNVLVAETRRNAHIRNEGNPLAYFDADEIRLQHQLQLQQQYQPQQDDGLSWSRQSSFKRVVLSSNESVDVDTQSSAGSSVTSMNQCLQENYVYSQPADPNGGLGSSERFTRRQHRVSDTGGRRHRSININGDTTSSNTEEHRDGDFIAVQFRFAPEQSGAATSLMILQSLRSTSEAVALARVKEKAQADRPELEFEDTEDNDATADEKAQGATILFIVAKKKFALPPSEKRRKSFEERLHQRVVERFGRFSVVGGSTSPDSPNSAMIALTTMNSNNAKDMFGSFEKVAPFASQDDCQVERCNRKQFAVASVVLSRRETLNSGCDEPLLCVHSIFSSEAEATEFALRLGPSPLRNALVCVLPTQKWLQLKDAYEWCVQVEPDRREKRASTSTMVVSPNRNKPPVRMFPPPYSISATGESPPKWRTDQVEAARLHQFICARMGLPRNLGERGGGGDDSGFTPKPAASLEDKLGALQEYLSVSSTNVAVSRSATLATMASGPGTPNSETHAAGAPSSAVELPVSGEGSKLLGKVRQMKRFGSIMRSRIFSHTPVPSKVPGATQSSPMHQLLPP